MQKNWLIYSFNNCLINLFLASIFKLLTYFCFHKHPKNWFITGMSWDLTVPRHRPSIWSACLHPRCQAWSFHSMMCRYPSHVTFHFSICLHTFCRRARRRCRGPPSYRSSTGLRIFDRRAIKMCPDLPFCCWPTYRRIFGHLTNCRCRDLEYCCLQNLHRMCFHRPK